ncbi:MAG: LemA family protein [Candidatus Omnitrophica bacterium]|nr:LemA family protein [Candidatus Omnitrophota bacterium]MDD5654172.1 LemA family protein [Candidatus Omnitrophota bacterium]
MNKIFGLLGLLILVIVIGASWYINGLNKVVILDENVRQAWAQVETQLQRRMDLIPNLVDTVKGYAAYEKGVFENVTLARSQWAGAKTIDDKVKAATSVDSAIARLLMVVENYPTLKASENFKALQDQLEGTENRISVERMRYNQAVMTFNAYIRTVFGVVFAKSRGLNKPAVYFEGAKGSEKVPEVKFQ